MTAVLPKPYRNPFPTAREVRLFVNTDNAEGQPIYSNPKGRVLTATQRTQLESLIAIHTIAPDDEFTMCFIPHHFFRYFDKDGKQVGEIAVCFCCAGVQQSEGSQVRVTKDEILGADFGKLQSFVASLGERTDVQCEDEV